MLLAVLEETVSELHQDARVEAGVAEVEPKEVLSIDADADREVLVAEDGPELVAEREEG